MSTSKSVSRRTLLRGAGVALALPLLESMVPSRAAALAIAAGGPAVAQQKRRMVAICTNLGIHTPYLNPIGAGREFALTPYLEPFRAMRDQLTVVSGVSHPGVDGGHSAEASFLTAQPHPGTTGFRNSVSLDQYAVEKLLPDTRYSNLVLAAGGGSLSWTRGGVQVPSDRSPSKVFAKLFLDGSQKEVDEQVARLREGRSVMDTVNAQAKTMGRDMGKADRDKLDEYFTGVRELEGRLAKAQEWSTKPKPQVDAMQPIDITDRADVIGRIRLMYDLMHLAIQTDSSRIITLAIECGGEVPPIPGVTEGHHNLSHHGKDPEKLAQLKAVELAEFQALADFLTKLQRTREEGETLLDRTMVFFGSNLGNASSHDNKNMPAFLAGGGFRHAGHLAFDEKNNTPLCNLYVSMLQRMGIETDSFASGKTRMTGLEF
jgi:hypothetical protein